uniref:Major facilitator superfamily (MFS) profile domain-containing protein n=1 Tax=Heliothis virescens TaxID=7102 RepID=A0A2A4JIZ6_HELVI
MGMEEKIPEYEYSKVPTKPMIAESLEKPTAYGYGVRHVQLLICLLSLTVNFIARGHMGVTVVAMTSPRDHVVDINYVDNNTGVQNEENYMLNDINNVTTNNISIDRVIPMDSIDQPYKTFDWPKSTQEMVLGSFFLGYCIMTFPMGLVVQRWGGKIPLQIALFFNGVISILTPWLINWGGWKAVCACRIVQGLSQAGVYPSIQTLLAKWVPASERASLTSYVHTGSIVGTVLAFQLSGFLSESKWGWPSAFWVVGLICLFLFAILTVFGAASPAVHKTISDEEKNYILGRIDDGKVRRLKTPWKAIICSRPMWGTLATHVGSGTSFVFFFTQVPSYIHYILGVNVRSSGLLSSLPYIVSFFTSVSFGTLSDFLTNRNIISVRNARRIFNSISQVGVAVSLICAAFATSTVVGVLCLVCSMGCQMAMHVGWMVNHIDLAPNFSGTLMMMGNALMNVCNVLLPVLVSYVVTDVKNQIQWRIMFFTVAALTLTTNALFVLLMSAETQPWNDVDDCVNFIARGHMGVTVVAMTSPSVHKLALKTNITGAICFINDTNPQNGENITENNFDDGAAGNISIEEVAVMDYNNNQSYSTYDWPKSTQEMVLGSFFLGYCIMTFPMGMVVQRWGGKIPMQIALFINGIVSVLAPWLINWGSWKAVCACRIAQGLSQAGVYPSIQDLLAKWVPVSERGSLTSYVYTGSTIGTVLGFQLSGILSESRWGWPSAFWAIGLICLAFFALLTVFGAASPANHKSISDDEKNYILGRIDDGKVRRHKIPWKAIITSRPLWGTLATHVGASITFVFFFTQVPSYIHYILGIDVKSSGLLSSLPYLVSFFTSIAFGIVSDFMTNRKIVTVRDARRIFNSISQVGVAVSLICASYTTSTVIAVFCLVCAMGCHMAIHVGWMVNHIDLAPNFSGTLMTLGNTITNIGCVLLPVLVSHVVTDVYNPIQWRIMFFTIAALTLTTNALFVLLMSADTQPWNDLAQHDTVLENVEMENKEKQEQ